MVEKKIVPDDKERKQFTRKDITRFCHVTRKFLDDYLPPLQDGEFLEIVQGGQGRKYIYEMPQLPDEEGVDTLNLQGLRTPAELAEAIQLAEGLG